MVNKNTPITKKPMPVFNFIIVTPPFLADPASWEAIIVYDLQFCQEIYWSEGDISQVVVYERFFWMWAVFRGVSLKSFPGLIKLG